MSLPAEPNSVSSSLRWGINNKATQGAQTEQNCCTYICFKHRVATAGFVDRLNRNTHTFTHSSPPDSPNHYRIHPLSHSTPVFPEDQVRTVLDLLQCNMFVMAIAAATLIQHALCHMKAPYKYMQLLKDYFGHIIYPEAQIHS